MSLLIRDNRSELLKVTDHQELNSAEWLCPVTKTPQDRIHRIQKVTSYHTYLIYDQDIYSLDNAPLLLAESELGLHLHSRNVWMKRQLEERMYGHATGIYGSYACRGHDHNPLAR